MREKGNSDLNRTVDHLFRSEAGKMVSVLTGLFGFSNIEQAEDIVQDTILQALQFWKFGRMPENPQAWLYKVAKNKAIDVIRRETLKYKIESEMAFLLRSEYTLVPAVNELFNETEIKDSQLSMMFACCHPDISIESQITLMLKILCGFSTTEIAKAFLSSEETISKRLYRTKEFFREKKIQLKTPSLHVVKENAGVVLSAIYLLFNEGYNSTQSESLIRQDLIEEAMRLCRLLTENQNTQIPEVYALMALMCFHAARSGSRIDPEGEMILLQMQDRSKWNRELIREGNDYMNKSAFGEKISSYHLEAAIVFEHCIAENFESTNWKNILAYYRSLCRISDSPVTSLNMTIALMEVEGPGAALLELDKISDRKKMESYYLYHSLLGEIQSRLKNPVKAKSCYESAIRLTKSETEKKMLCNKIAALFN